MDYVPEDPRIAEVLETVAGWQQIMTSVPTLIIAIDRQLRVAFVSTAVGNPEVAERAIGASALEFVDDEHKDLVREAVEYVFRTGEPTSYEVLASDQSTRGPRRYLSNVGPVREPSGDVVLAAIMSNDITERYELEQDRKRALEAEQAASAKLRELDDLKNEFVAKVVHDLRTPITVIRGFADTLQRRWDDIADTDKVGYLEHMSASTARLQRLVDDIMRVSQLEAGALRYEIDEFDLRDLVRSTVDELVASVGGSGITIRGMGEDDDAAGADAEPAGVVAVGDALRYRQVITNLLANAMRYSPPDQAIEVEVERADDRFWRVAVRDHGPGIAPEDHDRLFRKFSQLGGLGASEGSGLGLYICRTIVEDQGGEIGVESTPGEGACFAFTLPSASAGPTDR